MLAHDDPRVVRWLGDDAAVVRGRAYAVTSVDAMVEGVHFPPLADGACTMADVGHRALAGALSDLAAMGADPGRRTLRSCCRPASTRTTCSRCSRAAQALAAAMRRDDRRRRRRTRPGADGGGDGRRLGRRRRRPRRPRRRAAGRPRRRHRHARRRRRRTRDRRGPRGGDAAARAALPAPAAAPRRGARAGGGRRTRDDRPVRRPRDRRPPSRAAQRRAARARARAAPARARRRATSRRALGRDPATFAATAGEDYELCVCVPPEARQAAEAAAPLTWIGTVEEGAPELDLGPRGAALRGFEHEL